MTTALTTARTAPTVPTVHVPAARPVALLFPGQGAQRARMGAGLYGTEPVFTAAMDELFAAFGADGDRLRADWLTGAPIDAVGRAQPLLLGVNHALGRMVLGWGVRPAALLGHSVGEISAAVLAGVFTLADAVRVLRDRVCLAEREPAGGMLAVAASVADLAPYLTADVVVGAVNAPRQTLLAGPDGPLDRVVERLTRDGYTCRRVPSRVAFHSPAMAGLAAASVPLLRTVALHPPRLPLYSAYTGDLLAVSTATDPAFWARHPVDPVLFWPTLDRLLRDRDVVLLDASPGQSLAASARRHPAVRAGHSDVVGLLPARPGPPDADLDAVRAALARVRAESLSDVEQTFNVAANDGAHANPGGDR